MYKCLTKIKFGLTLCLSMYFFLFQALVSPASPFGDSLLAGCLAGQVGAIYRPPEYRWMTDRPVNEATVKADC